MLELDGRLDTASAEQLSAFDRYQEAYAKALVAAGHRITKSGMGRSVCFS